MPQSDPIAILNAAFAGLPTGEDIVALGHDAKMAEARGYFDPVEDERLREAYTRYLSIRVALWDVVQAYRLSAKRVRTRPKTATHREWGEFATAFCAAELIVRTGEYLITLARGRDLIWRKLDEGDARYGVARKSFTRLYRQLTSAFRMHGFYKACDLYDIHRERIEAALNRPHFQSVQQILGALNLPRATREAHMARYRKFVDHSLRRRMMSATHTVVFTAFEALGSDIAELKIPLVKPPRAPKRVTADTLQNLRTILRPGDVFVTRHDDAMSNVFLPGFWPHSALYLGGDHDVLEAKKDGVLFRDLAETLQVDAFVVLRPRLPPAQIDAALARAREHAGKLYDFIFDFRTTDRLVCTEVIYRTYHGIADIEFSLTERAGRYCLSAEDLINQGVGQGWFDVCTIYGVKGQKLHMRDEARDILRQSFAAVF